MRKSIFIIILLFTSEAFAAPKLNGTAKELASHINGVIKTVTISASASKVVVPDRAIVRLIVINDNPSLARALKDNTDIRDKIKTQYQVVGIESGNISDSKLSMTPKFELFGEKPKSYTVKNLVTIEITTEQQLIKIASIVDRDENLFHHSTTTEVSNKESEYNLLLEKALENIKKKVGIYQKQLSVKLSPVSFVDSAENTEGFLCRNTSENSKEPAETGVCGLGATKLSTAVAVTYKVMPDNEKELDDVELGDITSPISFNELKKMGQTQN